MAKCRRCGHECHCDDECKECINDVCVDCNCDENIKDVPDSFTKENV